MITQHKRPGLPNRAAALTAITTIIAIAAITILLLTPGTVRASLSPQSKPLSVTATFTPEPPATATGTAIIPTPSGEPEMDILALVVATHPEWTCGPIYGTPGHRTVSCYTGAGHIGTGTVDNYNDPGAALANWQQRRDHAQTLYPIFQNTNWGGYPGYHGEGNVPPYDFFTQEDYYWADVRVLGGTRVDDTGFHYAPDVPAAVMLAAARLGYLPTPSPTPTPSSTITSTPTPVPPCTLTFSDVPPDQPFHDYIMYLACRGIVGGYDDGSFKPDNEITRGQIAKIVSEAAGFSDTPAGQIFADVPVSDAFYVWVDRLAMHQVVTGYPCGGEGEPCGAGDLPYFRPSSSATRGQLAKIVTVAAGFMGVAPNISNVQTFEDVPPTHVFYVWIEELAGRGAIGGYPCGGPGEPCVSPDNRPYFRPSNNVTRGQAAKIVANTFFPTYQMASGTRDGYRRP